MECPNIYIQYPNENTISTGIYSIKRICRVEMKIQYPNEYVVSNEYTITKRMYNIQSNIQKTANTYVEFIFKNTLK